MAQKEKYKNADLARGVKALTKQRSKSIDQVEKLLLIWINEMIALGNRLSDAVICNTARMLFAELSHTNEETQPFKASRGWVDKFKRRVGISDLIRCGTAYRAILSNTPSTSNDSSNEHMQQTPIGESYENSADLDGLLIRDQLFSIDETSPFWNE
ncbi:unnamed protein product, partial [Anisakis simplex]|uniref:HTH CENPB-type domain-containing protein n=1 Tax=Anisakis simplex TaxID=6269 RepID=A0A0M3JAN1_ANISI